MERSKWIWMPHPGHFICARDCQFFLNTYVGGYIVSTVGELFPSDGVREIYAKSRGVTLEGIGDARRNDYMKKIGFEKIGCDRKYETMVFKAGRAPKGKTEACCPFRVSDFGNLDGNGYNEPGDAYQGHMKLCLKWSKKK